MYALSCILQRYLTLLQTPITAYTTPVHPATSVSALHHHHLSPSPPHSHHAGLATYALNTGQPVNSVLDGVLPLHVACSGGSEVVVRLLIERGADVNAARLPRKYAGKKESGVTIGTSGMCCCFG